MKILLNVALVLMLTTGIAVADSDSWFDMQNCEICVGMTENPELMQNMTWNHYDVDNGMVSVTNVEPAFLDAYNKAHAKMDVAIKRAQAGEALNMCNMCKGIGGFSMAGAKMESVESGNVFIGLTTASDPKVVDMIHTWAERTRSEMMKMSENSSHEGHNH